MFNVFNKTEEKEEEIEKQKCVITINEDQLEIVGLSELRFLSKLKGLKSFEHLKKDTLRKRLLDAT